MAIYYRWKINKINLYPFGGLIKFDEPINRPIKEELLILLAGPLIQITFYLLMIFMTKSHLFLWSTLQIFKNYHYSILIFNLLPIHPLDGSKLLNLCFSFIFPYKKAHLLMIYNSFIVLLIIILAMKFIALNTSMYMLLIVLVFKVLEEKKNHNSLFNKFLLERYLYKFRFHKTKFINNANFKKMMRDNKHLFYVDGVYITEKEMLRKRFR